MSSNPMRWNFAMIDRKLMVCYNDHPKGQPCEWVPVEVATVEAYRKLLVEKDKQLHGTVTTEYHDGIVAEAMKRNVELESKLSDIRHILRQSVLERG